MIPFSYQPGTSLVHRMPPVLRLLLFCYLIILLNPAGLYLQLGVFALLVILQIHCRVSLKLPWRTLVFFAVMAGLLFWGEYNRGSWPSGILRTSRFLLTLHAGLLFAAVNDPMELGESLYRLTKPIPLFPAGKLMILVTLTLGFLPLIGQEAQELRDALKSRGLDRHPNPFRRAMGFTLPLISGVVRRSYDIAQAMYSRCYQQHPTLLSLSMELRHGLLLLLATALLSLKWIIPRFYP